LLPVGAGVFLALRPAGGAAIQTGGLMADIAFSMSFQTILRTIGFLIILFLVVYVSIENTQVIDFHFSMVAEKPVRSSAAIIYFGMFAVGVIGGTLLHNGGKGGGGGGSGSKKK
jgi:preprotein translocase subunit SecG